MFFYFHKSNPRFVDIDLDTLVTCQKKKKSFIQEHFGRVQLASC